MRITELLKKQSIELGVKAASKEEAIDRLIALMDAGGRLNDRVGYKEGILAREKPGEHSNRGRDCHSPRKGRSSKGTGAGSYNSA